MPSVAGGRRLLAAVAAAACLLFPGCAQTPAPPPVEHGAFALAAVDAVQLRRGETMLLDPRPPGVGLLRIEVEEPLEVTVQVTDLAAHGRDATTGYRFAWLYPAGADADQRLAPFMVAVQTPLGRWWMSSVGDGQAPDHQEAALAAAPDAPLELVFASPSPDLRILLAAGVATEGVEVYPAEATAWHLQPAEVQVDVPLAEDGGTRTSAARLGARSTWRWQGGVDLAYVAVVAWTDAAGVELQRGEDTVWSEDYGGRRVSAVTQPWGVGPHEQVVHGVAGAVVGRSSVSAGRTLHTDGTGGGAPTGLVILAIPGMR